MATELAGKGGQWITAGFMFVTALMRTYSKKLVSAKKKTDDQLTGMSIPLLAISAALLTVLPYQFSWIGLATALAAAAHYVGTAVPGQLDNTRMQNMVSAMIQEEKQKIQDDTNLTEAQREEELERVNRKEKEWASLASASYSYANGWGLFGVLVAVGLGFLLNDIPAMEALLQNFSINVDYGAMVNEFLSNVREGISSLFSWFAPADLYTSESNSLTMQRFVFLMSTGALSYLAVKNWDLTRDFFRGLRKPKVTTETIQAGKVNASTFGVSAKNAAQNLTKIGKEIQSMKDRLVAFGVISEKKMTDLYNQLVMTYNRLNAVREVQGMSPMVQSTFDKLFEVSRSYASLLGKHKMSVMLERQFQKFSETISKEGTLETLAETPVYMAEGEYALPQAYEKFEEAKLLIQEMNQLAGKIRDNNVRSDTYKLFIQYYNRVRDNLTLYGKLNLADSNRVLLMEQELEQLCRALKKGDAMSGILETNKGPVSSSDVQLLRDLLQGVPEASAAY